MDTETSSQAGERYLTTAQREEMERKRKRDIREAHRQRLMGVKKEVVQSKGIILMLRLFCHLVTCTYGISIKEILDKVKGHKLAPINWILILFLHR